MKKNLLLFMVLCFSITSYAQGQRNYAQEFVDLLFQGRYFDARDYKMRYADQLPKDFKMLDLLYDISMSLAFNKPDSAILYIEDFLGNQQETEQMLGPNIVGFYIRLSDLYEEKQQYELAIATYEKFINYLIRNPFSQDQEFIKNQMEVTQILISSLKEKMENEPIQKIARDADACEIELKEDPYIRFDAQYNGKTVETFFNTGISRFFLIEKDLADDLGVKYSSDPGTGQALNGKEGRISGGTIDSIDIQGIKLYNIPVLVFFEKFSSYIPDNFDVDYKEEVGKHIYKERQIIMGVPTMKMIGRFEFDWESNTLCIPQKQKSVAMTPISNLMILQNRLYLNMKINDTEFMGLLDTGGNHFFNLSFPYFFKATCKSEETKKLNYTSFMGVYENIEHQRVKEPQIFFDGRNISNSEPGREVYAIDNIESDNNKYDGVVGIKFIKNIGSKCIIDFDAMTVECKK
jgi:hypothetical protein